jgi:NAD(P)-dependent dehydrogenase (short-subunit alcohol dehydrogenase family)
MILDELSAIVTGGASGLGLATAQTLIDKGVRVTIFDLPSEAAAQAADHIGAHFAAVDVTNEEQVKGGLDLAAKAFGVPRILVNCAGIAPAARVVGRKGVHSLDLFETVIRINLIGTFNVLRLFAERLAGEPAIDGERGVIINTASAAAFEGQTGQSAYAASKAAIAGMTICLARDLSDQQIRVMTIAPGIFLTPMLMSFPKEVHEKLAADIPHPQRLGSPADFGALAVHIIENPYLNGETIRLDGALRMAK